MCTANISARRSRRSWPATWSPSEADRLRQRGRARLHRPPGRGADRPPSCAPAASTRSRSAAVPADAGPARRGRRGPDRAGRASSRGTSLARSGSTAAPQGVLPSASSPVALGRLRAPTTLPAELLREVPTGARRPRWSPTTSWRADPAAVLIAFCAPCRATRRVSQTSRPRPRGDSRELDAEHHLDLVRRVGVLRTPTTLVLDAAGARSPGPPVRRARSRCSPPSHERRCPTSWTSRLTNGIGRFRRIAARPYCSPHVLDHADQAPRSGPLPRALVPVSNVLTGHVVYPKPTESSRLTRR